MSITKSQTSANILIALATVVVLFYFFPRSGTQRYNYELGRPWAYAQLLAPFDIPIRPDTASVARATDSLKKVFVPVYRYDAALADSLIRALPRQLTALQRQGLAQMLRRAYAHGVMPNQADRRAIPGATDTLRLMRANVLQRTSSAALISIDTLRTQVLRYLSHGATDQQRPLIAAMAQMITPNVIYDPQVSQGMWQNELLPFTSDRGTIQQGQTIIDKGHVITPTDYAVLQTYDSMMTQHEASSQGSRLWRWAGQALFIIFVLGGLMAYFYTFAPRVIGQTRPLLCVMSLVAFVYIFAAIVGTRFVQGVYLTPFALVPIVLAVFFDGRTALMAGVSVVLLAAAAVGQQLEFIFVQLAGVCAAVLSIRTLTRRSQLIQAAVVTLVCMWAAYCAFELMLTGSLDGITLRRLAIILGSAVLTSFAYIVIYIYEKAFGFMSAVTLIELADINNPLLRQLSDDCPGTFQHSMAVSTLAADAASRLGANVQLVRTGALYHDVGKLSNPAFFTENQSGVNPHDALTPRQSASIIINHVTDGLRRAEKIGLPRAVTDFILQHHGRGVAKYFYYKELEAHPGEKVDAEPFTYPGPNPQTLEASIMMMADSVEAASRSLASHTPDDIAALVDKIIDGQVADGLHNQSPLALRDIALIKDTFIRRLKTIYHARIVYPEVPKQ